MAHLGDRVRDRINGFEGIVTGRAEYLFGCRQVLVAPTVLGEHGKVPESCWLDEDRVALVEVEAVPIPATAVEAGGGPLTCPAPPVR
jgi:hypothetical protein